MNKRKDLTQALATAQERLGQARGQQYWRSLDELADTPAFREMMRYEFPEQADIWPDGLSRRQFLTLMGASLALAGLSGCSVHPAPSVDLTPYVQQPEEAVPGRSLYYATTMTMSGVAVGLLVQSHLGRPTKIEGNPDHPASRGATDIYNQASVLTLYDPDRSPDVTVLGRTVSWEAAFAMEKVNGQATLGAALAQQREKKGRGLRILTETIVSPTLGAQLEALTKADGPFPEAHWHQYEPLGRDAERRGAQNAYGRHLNTYYDFTKADIVVSLDNDFLSCGPGKLNYVRDFMSRRRVRGNAADSKNATMNRFYVVETDVSTTGAKADHRLAVPRRDIEAIARALASQLDVQAAGKPQLDEKAQKFVEVAARDLKEHRGRCVVLAGERQSPAVQLLAHALNSQLGNIGQTVLHTEPIEIKPTDQLESLRDLVTEMRSGSVELLLILGGNPVYTAPADLQFKEAMGRVPLRAHLALYQDETSRQCQWYLPEAHYLEAWGDARAFDGTASLVQPLILPLYHGRSAIELAAMVADPNFHYTPGLDLVRDYWQKHRPGAKSSEQKQLDQGSPSERQQREAQERSEEFENFWQTSLQRGIIADTEVKPLSDLRLSDNWERNLGPLTGGVPSDTIEVVIQPDPTIYDGQFANNGWLQELPNPITMLTWDNAALMSPATAKRLNVGKVAYEHGGEHGGYVVNMVKIQGNGAEVEAPIWIVPGHADNSISISLGYGRQNAGRVGGSPDNQVGFNAYLLRTSRNLWFIDGAQVSRSGRTFSIACTQGHQLMERRDPVRAGTLAEFRDKPHFAREKDEKEEAQLLMRARQPLDLYPDQFSYEDRQKWGMAIDLTACVGCKACVVACQAENNSPVVGKPQVLAGREMHWLRIDLYHKSPASDPTGLNPTEFYFQPVPCMQCEDAPCEYVCPVEATVHSAEGLNDMIYQRCVGTRFCSNNCPYKVRRFNFFLYSDWDTPSRRLQYNPDVTVRSRGVMEKCSYCVQRIRHAEIDAQVENRPIADGEVLTACQAACPADAIVFGNINQARFTGKVSAVKQLKDSPLNYELLGDLNTKPRTTYLAAIRNPHPDLETE